MGVLEYRDLSYPVDDFTLAHLRAVLENLLPEFPYIDLALFFSSSDPVEFRLTADSLYSISVRTWPSLCDRCLADLLTEVELSGALSIVGGSNSGWDREHPV